MIYFKKDANKYIELPVRQVTDDIEIISHPNGSGIILVIGGVRHGIPWEQAEKLPEAIAQEVSNARSVPVS